MASETIYCPKDNTDKTKKICVMKHISARKVADRELQAGRPIPANQCMTCPVGTDLAKDVKVETPAPKPASKNAGNRHGWIEGKCKSCGDVRNITSRKKLCTKCSEGMSLKASKPKKPEKPAAPARSSKRKRNSPYIQGICSSCGRPANILRVKKICRRCLKNPSQPSVTIPSWVLERPRVPETWFDVSSWLGQHPELSKFVRIRAERNFRSIESEVLTIIRKAADRALEKAAKKEAELAY